MGPVMDFSLTSVTGGTGLSAPRHAIDLRPTADSAALARDPRPDIPLVRGAPMPNGDDPPDTAETPDTAVARVLKPFGVTMLPASDNDLRERARGRDAREPSRADAQSVTVARAQIGPPAP